MRNVIVAGILVSASSLAFAEDVSGIEAEKIAEEAGKELVKTAGERGAPDVPWAAGNYTEQDSDLTRTRDQGSSKRYGSTGKLSVSGTRISGELPTLQNRSFVFDDPKTKRGRSITWDWKTKQGRLIAEGQHSKSGIKVGPRSTLLARRSDDGSAAAALLHESHALTIDAELHAELHPERSIWQTLRLTRIPANPLVEALGLPEQTLGKLVQGKQIQLQATRTRTSNQPLHTLAARHKPPGAPANEDRPPSEVTRARSYALVVDGKTHTIGEAGYRAFKARMRR
jgi:hypothetical protein